MKRLRTFDQYWNEDKHPSAARAWDICAEERQEVIDELKRDLTSALRAIEETLELMDDSDTGKRIMRDWIDHKKRQWNIS